MAEVCYFSRRPQQHGCRQRKSEDELMQDWGFARLMESKGVTILENVVRVVDHGISAGREKQLNEAGQGGDYGWREKFLPKCFGGEAIPGHEVEGVAKVVGDCMKRGIISFERLRKMRDLRELNVSSCSCSGWRVRLFIGKSVTVSNHRRDCGTVGPWITLTRCDGRG